MSIFKSVKKRMVASVIGATMLFSLVPAAFASTADAATVNATVTFVNQTSDVPNPATLIFPINNVPVNLDSATLVKPYLPAGTPDPLPGTVSVLDCVIAAVGNYSKTLGWDANPQYGSPGGWIDDMFGLIGVDYEDNTHWWGKGWTCTYLRNNVQNIPSGYLSNIPAQTGDVITMTFAPYDYPKN